MSQAQRHQWLASDWCQRKIADYKPYTAVDGEGVRCSLYVSGCLFACQGCYNLIAQNFHYGTDYTLELEERILQDIAMPYCQGLTLLGGEPFLNTPVTLPLCEKFRQRFGQAKDIWAWTGYTWEELQEESTDKKALLSHLDVIVDGRFDMTQKDLTLPFRGSRNQRIIDVQKSLVQGEVVLWESEATQV